MKIDIEYEPVAALSCVTIMYNEVSLKRPDSDWLKMLNTIEVALRTQRETNQKQAGEIARLKKQLSRL